MTDEMMAVKGWDPDEGLSECEGIPAALVLDGDEPQEMWVSDDTYGYCGCGTPPDKIYFVCLGGCVKYTPTKYSVDKWGDTHE